MSAIRMELLKNLIKKIVFYLIDKIALLQYSRSQRKVGAQ